MRRGGGAVQVWVLTGAAQPSFRCPRLHLPSSATPAQQVPAAAALLPSQSALQAAGAALDRWVWGGVFGRFYGHLGTATQCILCLWQHRWVASCMGVLTMVRATLPTGMAGYQSAAPAPRLPAGDIAFVLGVNGELFALLHLLDLLLLPGANKHAEQPNCHCCQAQPVHPWPCHSTQCLFAHLASHPSPPIPTSVPTPGVGANLTEMEVATSQFDPH